MSKPQSKLIPAVKILYPKNGELFEEILKITPGSILAICFQKTCRFCPFKTYPCKAL
jgi:hypothetical protein